MRTLVLEGIYIDDFGPLVQLTTIICTNVAGHVGDMARSLCILPDLQYCKISREDYTGWKVSRNTTIRTIKLVCKPDLGRATRVTRIETRTPWETLSAMFVPGMYDSDDEVSTAAEDDDTEMYSAQEDDRCFCEINCDGLFCKEYFERQT